MSDNDTPIESADTTPEFSYQVPEPTPVEVSAPATVSPTLSSAADVTHARERVAFEAYVRNQGGKIPENFKDAGAWFDSLKNAQKEYTQTKQQIAELKQQYAKDGTNTSYTGGGGADATAPAQQILTGDPTIPAELRIPQQAEPEVPVVPETPVATPASETDWQGWTKEYAISGTLSDATKTTISERTGLPDYVISEYMEGQKAKLSIAYEKAGSILGGKDKLNTLFMWASKNLSRAEQDNMNASLASPSWEITLLGLNAKYDKMTASHKTEEPEQIKTTKKVTASSAQNTLVAYRTKREFSADRNNPRFAADPKYREAVEKRMMQTDFSKLQP